jgi:predicted Zn-dependent protease
MKGLVLAAFVLVLGVRQALPQVAPLTTPIPGINFFSPQQDIDIGNESSLEAEKQLSLVQDVRLNQYVRSIAQRVLSGSAPPPNRFQFHIVNSNEGHSLAFPNGAIYIYRGLLGMTSNDAEVAAIIAHEVSHVLCRHATSQLSRQLLVQAPISLSAGLPMSEGWKEQLNKLGVVFGVNAPFLHYSPEQEAEASAMTSKLLRAARFDDEALDELFQRLMETSKKPDAPILTFLYNHPLQEPIVSPESDADAVALPRPEHRVRPSLEFRGFQAGLQKLPKPLEEKTPEVAGDPLPGLLVHPSNYYRLNYPEGWQVSRTGKDGAIVAPPDGLSTSTAGDDVVFGMMVDMFDLSTSDKTLTLEQATNRLIVYLRQRNQTVRAVPGAQTPILIDDELGLRTVLLQGGVIRGGNSIITGKTNLVTEPGEVLWLVTRMYYQNLFYMVFVAPEEEFPSHQQLFDQIIRNLHMR